MPNLPRSRRAPRPGRLLLRANWILPGTGPAIPRGAVWIDDGRITAVGEWKTFRPIEPWPELDLGSSVVLPGFINAHCHLDYTDMAGQIPPPKSFSNWIKALLALKAHRTFSDYAASWLQGARMLLAHGTTTVADIEAVPELLPDVLTATPLRVGSFLELTGVRSRRPVAEILREAIQLLAPLHAQGHYVGLSPHAPYSTTPELLRLTAEAARLRDWPVAVHAAESAEEFDMFCSGTGAMFDWLAPQRNMADCGLGSPVAHLHRHGLLNSKVVAVHVNYLAPGDADLLAREGVTVVHCPRSHAYFGHAPFPFKELSRAGVNVCLGTDSLASVRRLGRTPPELDLLAEMRALAAAEPELKPDDIIRLATVNAARALGFAGQLGELSVGAEADLIVVPCSPRTRDAARSVLQHKGPVPGVMIRGEWVVGPPALPSHA